MVLTPSREYLLAHVRESGGVPPAQTAQPLFCEVHIIKFDASHVPIFSYFLFYFVLLQIILYGQNTWQTGPGGPAGRWRAWVLHGGGARGPGGGDFTGGYSGVPQERARQVCRFHSWLTGIIFTPTADAYEGVESLMPIKHFPIIELCLIRAFLAYF